MPPPRSPRSLGRLRRQVERLLSPAERLGEPYEMDTLRYNLRCVDEDVAAGRVPEPTSADELARAIADEYRENLRSFAAAAESGQVRIHVVLWDE
jgi:hypothetical protein